jgi:3-methyladenine DNA glycosylase AlkD
LSLLAQAVWERRIAVLATSAFIGKNDFEDALAISKLLLVDRCDLIHKAVGWMLREIGKKDEEILEKFLNEYSMRMPRTMLRYSIEKLSKNKRKYYLLAKLTKK